VDLEARTRELFAAMDGLHVERILSFFAEGGRYEVRGVFDEMDKAAYERYLRAVRRRLASVSFKIGSLSVKRNVAFVEWTCVGLTSDGEPYSNRGVHVLSWDQDGRIAHATVFTEPEKVRELVDETRQMRL
jgi:ketosteroid isomerase-like protein